MAKTPALTTLLRSALKRKQLDHPEYSLRALARDWGVSAAFASNVFSGKRPPPKDRLERLCYCLELDVLERESVVRTVLLDGFSTKILHAPQHRSELKARKTSEASNKNVLSSWANIAVLEGLTLEPPHNDPEVLRRRLNLSATEFTRSLKLLESAGLIHAENGVWQKNDDLLYVAGGRSRREVREFHERMILMARQELMGKTATKDFQRRLINGATITLNPVHLERLKAMVIGFLDELAQEAATGPCSEVYQCNFQLFPLTRSGDE